MSRSVSFNVLAMVVAKFLPAVVAFAINIAIARVAGVEILGAYANLLALQMIFQALTGAGLHLLVAREVAASPARASVHAQRAMMTGLFTGVTATLASALYAVVVLPDDQVLPALVLTSTVLPTAWMAVQDGIFVGARRHHLIALVAAVESAVKLIAAGVALTSGLGLFGVSVAIAVSRLIAFVIGSILVRRLGVTAIARVRLGAVMEFAGELAPFAALFVISMIYFRVAVPIVQLIAGGTETGLLAAAVTLYGALLLLPESILSAAYPRLCAAFNISRDGFVAAMWLVAKGLTVSLVVIAMVLIAASDVIVTAIYGPAFAESAALLRLFAVALPIHALNGALGQALQSGGQQRAMVSVVATGLGTHIILTVLFVRAFGVRGAALAMIVSSAVVACGALRALHRHVAAVHVSARAVAWVVVVGGPLVFVSVAGPEIRLPATAAGLVWLAIVLLWYGRFIRADVDRVRETFSEASPRAIA